MKYVPSFKRCALFKMGLHHSTGLTTSNVRFPLHMFAGCFASAVGNIIPN